MFCDLAERLTVNKRPLDRLLSIECYSMKICTYKYSTCFYSEKRSQIIHITLWAVFLAIVVNL